MLPYEGVWCVFDREAQETARFQQAVVRAARQRRMHLAISNPSFEYWYLLHIGEYSRPFADGGAVLRELTRPANLPGYRKNASVYLRLKPQTEIASERAERLRAAHPAYPADPYPNPSTDVFELVRALLAMVGPGG